MTEPPSSIGGVRVGAQLRASGALVIHEGRNQLDLPFRVHLVLESDLGRDFGREGFLAAVRGAVSVQHTSLVPYVNGGRKGPWMFAIAKATDGRAVDELLGRGGALAPDRALGIAASVAEVLAAIESAGLRHGDLSPRRIHLPGRGRVSVRPLRLVPPEFAPRKARYQAPEEALGGAGDARSDQYVLGLILVEMLTAKSPVPGSGAAATRALAEGLLPPARGLVPGADSAVLAVIDRLLAVAPSERYPSAADAAAAIAAAARGEEEIPIPMAVPLDELAPETAPIDAAAVAAVLGTKPQTAPIQPKPTAARPTPRVTAPARAGPAPLEPPPEAEIKRSPGRLYLVARLGEAMLEIDEDVYVGRPPTAIDVVAQPDAFEEAMIHVERTRMADMLHALVEGVRVNGSPVDVVELMHGDTLSAPGLEGRYERTTRGAIRAHGRQLRSKRTPLATGILAACLLGCVGVFAWAAARVATINEQKGTAIATQRTSERALRAAIEEAAVRASDDSSPAAKERRARKAYETARSLARRRRSDPSSVRKALDEVASKHPGTAFGELAALEARTHGTGLRSELDMMLEKLLAESEVDVAEGRLEDALVRLRNFAEENLDTIAGERAQRESVRIQSDADARLETDLAQVRLAMAARDWRTALHVLDTVLDYVPRARKNEALALKAEIDRRMNSVYSGGGTSNGDSGPKPPTPIVPPKRDPVRDPDPQPVVDPAPPRGDPEALALQAFESAKRLMDGRKDPATAIRTLLAFLRVHRNTETGIKYENEARQRVMSLATGPAGITELFRGKVEQRERGRYRFTYDFEDSRQMLDFRDVNAFEAPPRADWQLTSGAARAKGSGAFVLDAHFKPDFLTMSVKINPERAHDLGIIFFEAGEQQRYYLYTVQNSYFTLGKPGEREKFQEHAIVLFGPDVWADTPPGEIGYVRKCGATDPKFAPGDELSIKAGKSEGEVWLRFASGRTLRGSAYGDVKYEFTGLTPGVFIVNSQGFFDEIVVEGVPDPDWVRSRWEDILEEIGK